MRYIRSVVLEPYCMYSFLSPISFQLQYEQINNHYASRSTYPFRNYRINVLFKQQ